jgi:hypothetical protein
MGEQKHVGVLHRTRHRSAYSQTFLLKDFADELCRLLEVDHLSAILHHHHHLLRTASEHRPRCVHHGKVVHLPTQGPPPVPDCDEKYGPALPQCNGRRADCNERPNMHYLPRRDGIPRSTNCGREQRRRPQHVSQKTSLWSHIPLLLPQIMA